MSPSSDTKRKRETDDGGVDSNEEIVNSPADVASNPSPVAKRLRTSHASETIPSPPAAITQQEPTAKLVTTGNDAAQRVAALQRRIAEQKAAIQRSKDAAMAMLAATGGTIPSKHPAAPASASASTTVAASAVPPVKTTDNNQSSRATLPTQPVSAAPSRPSSVKQQLPLSKATQPTPAGVNPYLVEAGLQQKHGRRALEIRSGGKHIAAAAAMRMRQLAKQLAINTYQPSADAAPPLTVMKHTDKESDVPLVEWWDAAILVDEGAAGYRADIAESKLNSYVYHPVLLPVVGELPPPPPKPAPLTKRERRKLAKRARAARHKEAQDRVRLGIDPTA